MFDADALRCLGGTIIAAGAVYVLARGYLRTEQWWRYRHVRGWRLKDVQLELDTSNGTVWQQQRKMRAIGYETWQNPDTGEERRIPIDW